MAQSKRGQSKTPWRNTTNAAAALGFGAAVRADEPTEFEKLLLALGMEQAGPEMLAQDRKVRKFVKQYRTQRYIPEEVLACCGAAGMNAEVE